MYMAGEWGEGGRKETKPQYKKQILTLDLKNKKTPTNSESTR